MGLFWCALLTPLAGLAADSTKMGSPPQSAPMLFCPTITILPTGSTTPQTVNAKPSLINFGNVQQGDCENRRTNSINFIYKAQLGGVNPFAQINPFEPSVTCDKNFPILTNSTRTYNPQDPPADSWATITIYYTCCKANISATMSVTGQWTRGILDPVTNQYKCKDQ